MKDSLEDKLSPSDLTGLNNVRYQTDTADKYVIENLENQLSLMRKERENAMEMWQNSLQIISNLENELKVLFFSICICLKIF